MIWTFISWWNTCCCANRIFLWSTDIYYTVRHHQDQNLEVWLSHMSNIFMLPQIGGGPFLFCQCYNPNIQNTVGANNYKEQLLLTIKHMPHRKFPEVVNYSFVMTFPKNLSLHFNSLMLNVFIFYLSHLNNSHICVVWAFMKIEYINKNVYPLKNILQGSRQFPYQHSFFHL